MTIALGLFVLLVSGFGWVGQMISTVAPPLAVRWGLTEAAQDVDPTFMADIRAECVWDSLSLWTLPLAAILFMLDEPSWTVVGLVGGGMFLYFAGRGIAQRLVMQQRSIAVGKPSAVKTFYVFLTLWGVTGAATVGLAAHDIVTGEPWL